MILLFGFYLGLLTFSLVLLLDLFCVNIIKIHINLILYIKAFLYNIVNLLIISPVLYYYTVKYLCAEKQFNFVYTLFILLAQSILYHFIHTLMHTPLFYFTHRFHHKFNRYVIPMTANAVSIYEFLFAYMIPIIVPIYLIEPDYISMNIAISIISLNNILIHSPQFRNVSKYLPKIFVSTDKHMVHHKKHNKHFSAPTLDLDYILSVK